ncbi:fimbrillin family protein [Phocaeicola plebeius]|uniref:fimbrillin family protein n=1 Tax=Phocaeicola plebeius TaxID=310297 RepID=UPI0026F0D1B8|nr:fimbrillin family protein [Phocaeicola plebeius]
MKQTLLYGLAISSCLLFSCNREEMPNDITETGNPSVITLESVTLNDFSSNTSSRASYTQDAATVFEQDDKLGLILLDAEGNRIDHLSYSYISAENRWNLDDQSKYYSSKIKKIIAYFPYNSSLSNEVNTVEELKNTITIGADQSNQDTFKNYDLLVEEIDSPSSTLDVNLTHAFSLIEFQSDPMTLQANGKSYSYNVELQNVKMVIGDTDYQLCNINGTYSLLVKDGFIVPANDFRYFYSLGDDAYVKTLTTAKTTESGKKYVFPCKVDGEYKPSYAAGDFYCTDNEDKVVILPGVATNVPEGLTCQGIVFHYIDDFQGFATTNGITASAYPGYDGKHGLVIGFNAGNSFGTTQPTLDELKQLYTARGILESDYTSQEVMNGYAMTQAILNGEHAWDFTALGDYVNNPLPGATPWYAPSFKELKNMVWGSNAVIASENGLNTIIKQLEKLGKSWGNLQSIPTLTLGTTLFMVMTGITEGGNADDAWDGFPREAFRPICAF